MPKITKEVTIVANPGAVFDYLADISKHSEWAKHPIEIRKTSDGPIGSGSRWESDSKMMGSHHATIVMTDYVPGQRFAFETADDTGRYRHTFSVGADGAGTRLVRSVEMLGGSFLNKLLGMVAMPTRGSQIAVADIAKIKANRESSPAEAVAPA